MSSRRLMAKETMRANESAGMALASWKSRMPLATSGSVTLPASSDEPAAALASRRCAAGSILGAVRLDEQMQARPTGKFVGFFLGRGLGNREMGERHGYGLRRYGCGPLYRTHDLMRKRGYLCAAMVRLRPANI